MKATAAREHGLPPWLAWMDPFPCQGLRLATTPLLAKACLAVIFSMAGCQGVLGAGCVSLACGRPWASNPHGADHEHRIACDRP